MNRHVGRATHDVALVYTFGYATILGSVMYTKPCLTMTHTLTLFTHSNWHISQYLGQIEVNCL